MSKIFKVMMFFFWNKNYISNFKRNFIISPHKFSTTFGYNINFILMMWCLSIFLLGLRKPYLHILIFKDESKLAFFFNWNFYSLTYTYIPSACVCHNCLLLNDTILSSALGLKHQSVALLQTNKPRTKIPKSFFIDE